MHAEQTGAELFAEGAASEKPMERAGGRAHIYVLIETVINCNHRGSHSHCLSVSMLLQSVFPVTRPKLASFLLIFQLVSFWDN